MIIVEIPPFGDCVGRNRIVRMFEVFEPVRAEFRTFPVHVDLQLKGEDAPNGSHELRSANYFRTSPGP